ncbi:citrulline utilization hydrolase CtlX [Agriterribacter sp.]|uniref:citrulline utilization hydrolase CtlX n=1 Tax=Agriterribacter sp. TaxID=2821509 RepID=UPI002CA0AE4E|nr:arginine deiminase-related protein [Agriterribacter sp.]HRP56496.1 arginine deiminase-related protein [Agriterribacter sp.]
MQTASHLLMIRPVNFGFNRETAVNNAFQTGADDGDVQAKAVKEFEDFVQLLSGNDIDVTVVDDTPLPYTPDSVFPNNWISFHERRTVCLYPMFALNRRQERKPQLIEMLKAIFNISTVIDFTHHEKNNRFLEGTGSMVLDRRFKIAYACLSPRTDIDVLDTFCRSMKFLPVAFEAFDKNGKAIYHTNVMMCVADRYVVVCLESITNLQQRESVVSAIGMTAKKIIPITIEQMQHFAGNMLQVQNRKGKKFLIMSSQAYQSLQAQQIKELKKYNAILHSPLDTIEAQGGGSARCMIAEVFQ